MIKQVRIRLLLLAIVFITPLWIARTADSETESSTACAPPPAGLVSWWPGEGNANDELDGNDGTVAPGSTFVAGKVGQAFSFNGSSGHVNILDDGQGVSLDGFTQMTIDAWINPNSIGWPDPESGGNISAIVSKHDTTKANGVSFSLLQFNGKLRFVIVQNLNPDNAVGVISVDDIPIGTWSHVAGVWRGGTELELYLNGAKMAATFFSEGTTPAATANNNVPVNIGRIESFSGTFVGPAAFFDGLIDEVDVFNRGLSGNEIQAIYNSGSAGKCDSQGLASVFLPFVVKTVKPPAKIIQNGDFEAGPVDWGQFSSNGWQLILPENKLPISPHSGSWGVWMGGDLDETATIWQTVTIPRSDPRFRYWLWIASEDACGFDVAGVAINLDVVVDAFWLCSGNNTGGWIQRTIDLSDYVDQTVDIDILVGTDDTLNSNLFIDDVSLGNTARAGGENLELLLSDLNDPVSRSTRTAAHQPISSPDSSLRDLKLESLTQEMQAVLLTQNYDSGSDSP